MGVTRGWTGSSSHTRGNSMIANTTDKDKDGTKDDGTDRVRVSEIGQVATGNWQSKRKLRLEIDGLKSFSAPSSPTGNCSTLDLTWNKEEARSVKKSRTENTEEKRELQQGPAGHATAIRRIIKKLDEESRTISVLSKEKYTKREIKETSARIRSLMSQLLTQESQTLLQTLGSKMEVAVVTTPAAPARADSHEEMIKRIEKLEEDNKGLKKMIEDLTQQNKKLLESKQGRGVWGTERPKVVEDMFRNNDNYNDFTTMEDMIWPKDIFKVAFMVMGSPLKANKEADLVMLLEEGTGKSENEGVRKRFQDRYPELENVDDKVGAITVTTRAINREGTTIERERWIFKAEIDEGVKEWFDTLKSIKELAQKGGRKKLAIYPPGEDLNGIKTRKMLEFIFRDSGIKCLLYTKKQKGNEAKIRGTNNEKERKTEALVFRKEGRSYSELLRTFKEKVKPETAGAKAIRTIRDTRDGGMVVIIDSGNKNALKELQMEINKTGDLKVLRTVSGNETTLFINEIDGVTTKEEVREALSNVTGEDKNSIQVGELRKSFAGYQAVTVRLQKEKALELIKQEGIRIGLSLCPVRERVDVIQCFRCWKYGHIGRECKEGKDDSQLCRKCGGNGHVAKNCQKEDFCLTCKVFGHTAGSGMCPEFKKAVARERRERRKKRGY